MSARLRELVLRLTEPKADLRPRKGLAPKNRRELALDALVRVAAHLNAVGAPIVEIASIVDANQNDPPLGESDGSTTPTQWAKLRNAARALAEAEDAVIEACEALSP